MLSWLVLALTVLGAVVWGCAPVGQRKVSNKRQASSVIRAVRYQQYSLKLLGSPSKNVELVIRGRLADSSLRPMVGVKVYADASDCSLSLPLATSTIRKPCRDKRAVNETDPNGNYRLVLQVDHNQQRYLNVRFEIIDKSHQPERLVIPLQSVDQILGRMPVGSYYRLDNDKHRRLLSKRRDLIYSDSEVSMTANQLSSLREAAPFIHKNLVFSIADVIGINGALAVKASECLSGLSPAVHENTQAVSFHFLFPRGWNSNLLISGINSPICIDLGNERT